MKIYVKDMLTNHFHEVGSDRHDSLLIVNGGLQYYNLQCGEGTEFGDYKFCDKNGNTDFDDAEGECYYHIGFSEEKFKEQYEKDMEKLKKLIIGEDK